MSRLSLQKVNKAYAGGSRSVRDFDLEIADNEFIVIVGPSGCGKSTVLRMIAGLEDITSGDIFVDGERINDAEPKDRDMAMVFQNYGLLPRLTVRDNLGYGLKIRRVPKETIRQKVDEAAQALGIVDLLDKKPRKLSDAQRRRVALARAMVRRPKVFLLDEPLAGLDAKARVQMRTEIVKLHRMAKTTFVYATHDATEAMTMGTRVVVMKDGEILQSAMPSEIYADPADLFVACYFGSPQMNVLNATLVCENGGLFAVIGENEKTSIPLECKSAACDGSGKRVLLGIRPENVHLSSDAKEKCAPTVRAEIDIAENIGNETILYTKLDGKQDYFAVRTSECEFAQGERIDLRFDTDRIRLFDPDTGKAIYYNTYK